VSSATLNEGDPFELLESLELPFEQAVVNATTARSAVEKARNFSMMNELRYCND
jgi:hypothetical protein